MLQTNVIASALNKNIMTTKEKAKEIYKKVEFQLKYNSQPSTVNGMCKQICLLICDEILNLDIDANKLDYWYWQEVKQETQKL